MCWLDSGAGERTGQVRATGQVAMWPEGDICCDSVRGRELGALGSCALKRPKRAMVGAWTALDNRPVRPASRTATQKPSAPQVLTVVGRTNSRSDSGPAAAESGKRRDAPWQPNNLAAAPQPSIPATCVPPRWPTFYTCHPRPCPAGPRKASCPSSRRSAATVATRRPRSATWPRNFARRRRPETPTPRSWTAGPDRSRSAIRQALPASTP
jgi:hypothetical protein